jgi:hypothetical protein
MLIRCSVPLTPVKIAKRKPARWVAAKKHIRRCCDGADIEDARLVTEVDRTHAATVKLFAPPFA